MVNERISRKRIRNRASSRWRKYKHLCPWVTERAISRLEKKEKWLVLRSFQCAGNGWSWTTLFNNIKQQNISFPKWSPRNFVLGYFIDGHLCPSIGLSFFKTNVTHSCKLTTGSNLSFFIALIYAYCINSINNLPSHETQSINLAGKSPRPLLEYLQLPWASGLSQWTTDHL